MPIKLDAEKEGAEVAQKHGVRGFPTILFVNATGDVFGKIVGYMGPSPFQTEMAKAQKLFADYPKLVEAIKRNPDDGEANAGMALIHAVRGQKAEAAAALEKAEKAGVKGTAIADAYNAVGDLHQTDQKFDDAIRFFEKAAAATTDVQPQSYALISIMYCHVGKQDVEAAKKVAQQIVDLKGCSAEYVQMAKDVLK